MGAARGRQKRQREQNTARARYARLFRWLRAQRLLLGSVGSVGGGIPINPWQLRQSPCREHDNGTNWVCRILNYVVVAAVSKKKEKVIPSIKLQLLEFGPPEKFQSAGTTVVTCTGLKQTLGQREYHDHYIRRYETGTNWVKQILNDLTSAVSKNKEIVSPSMHLQMLEFGPPEKFQKMKNLPSPRVFTAHLHYDNIPKAVFETKAKILVVFRNPKDAAVSYYHFYNKNPGLPTMSSWDEFFQKFMRGEVCWGSYFDHALAWNKHMDEENIKIITYEEMKENLPGGVKQIAEFFGFSLPEETIESIAGNATFEYMNSKSEETHGKMAPILFRKGIVGDWKNLFTEAQSQEMDAKFEECLAGTKLGAKLKYDKYCKY
ncbi:sulfotransferase 6B1-like [Carettochelys insculpta]|uniref:sulfotransferase 6B1-like n=1 Tax=Carettochelys insculpta TaxID=44489 RepID=UPI003EBBA2FD